MTEDKRLHFIAGIAIGFVTSFCVAVFQGIGLGFLAGLGCGLFVGVAKEFLDWNLPDHTVEAADAGYTVYGSFFGALIGSVLGYFLGRLV